MAEWNSEQYLKFKKQRTQPSVDLANRIKDCNPKSVIDLGCGPGNSTHILKLTFPNADVMGIDNSANMIKKAKSAYSDLNFSLCDVHSIEGRYDLLFSNACLQWLPNHEKLLPELMGKLNDGGVLAVQIPMNGEEPLYEIMREIVNEPKWGFQSANLDNNATLTPNEYFNILSDCSGEFQIWETKYYHNLPNHKALVEWIKGTRIRPYLAHLSSEAGELFEQEIYERTKEAYPVMKNGEVILCFNRFFFVAEK